MTEKRLFRQKHPLFTGFFILGMMFLFFWAGITFFFATFSNSSRNPDLFGEKEGVGIVNIKGVITDSEEILDQLTRYRQSKFVKAIVVRIDSPGGAVGASQEIFREIARTDKVKPVVASMGSVTASGGFYAAIGAGSIVANPGTLTGSMGVILKFPNLEEIFDKIGYKDEVIKSGNLKDIGSPSRALTEEERNLLQALLDEVHEQFIADISNSRNIPIETIREIADGRIFSGQMAQHFGLVDQMGNFNDAVSLAANRAGIPSDNPHIIYPEEDQFPFLKLLAKQNPTSLLQNIATRFSPVLAYELTFN